MGISISIAPIRRVVVEVNSLSRNFRNRLKHPFAPHLDIRPPSYDLPSNVRLRYRVAYLQYLRILPQLGNNRLPPVKFT